jgi:hypothetical protein
VERLEEVGLVRVLVEQHGSQQRLQHVHERLAHGVVQQVHEDLPERTAPVWRAQGEHRRHELRVVVRHDARVETALRVTHDDHLLVTGSGQDLLDLLGQLRAPHGGVVERVHAGHEDLRVAGSGEGSGDLEPVVHHVRVALGAEHPVRQHDGMRRPGDGGHAAVRATGPVGVRLDGALAEAVTGGERQQRQQRREGENERGLLRSHGGVAFPRRLGTWAYTTIPIARTQ